MRQTLQESENIYRTIYENTGTAIAIADENKHALLVNEELCRITGYSREELTDDKTTWFSLVLDMIMPGLSGGETFDALRLIDPEVKVMLSTGYIISDQAKKIMREGCHAFIQKPFRMEELSLKIREALDQDE